MKMDITHKRKLAAYLLSKDFFNDEKQIDDTQSTLIDIISVLDIPINEIKDIAKTIKNKGEH